MIILHDGHGRFLEIEMKGENGIFFETDFFDVGLLPAAKIDRESLRDHIRERWQNEPIYFVDDVMYCMDQADDCKNGRGDFSTAGAEDIEIYAKMYDFNEVVL